MPGTSSSIGNSPSPPPYPYYGATDYPQQCPHHGVTAMPIQETIENGVEVGDRCYTCSCRCSSASKTTKSLIAFFVILAVASVIVSFTAGLTLGYLKGYEGGQKDAKN